MPWLELFAFSDNPEACSDVLDLLRTNMSFTRAAAPTVLGARQEPARGWVACPHAPCPPRSQIVRDHDWRDALIKLGTEQAALMLVTLICDGEITAGRAGKATN